ncbi:MAG: hypothetical protein IPM54_12725 [Polyangiaceae bacterium]|nr:hypothetical protein [Polyangiaceae bacterium]
MNTRYAAWRLLAALSLLIPLPACQASTAPTVRSPSSTATPPKASADASCPLPSGDPLCPLNGFFRETYAQRRAAMLAASGPILVQYGDKLVLLRNGQRLEGRATNERYHELKSVAHVPFAAYLLLAETNGPIDDALLPKLISFETLVSQALSSINTRFPDDSQRERQRQILSRSLLLLRRVIQEKQVRSSDIDEYVRAQRDDIAENVKDAARENIMTLHAQVTAWAALLTPEERNRLRVVVGASHMARPGNLALQYFAAWLGEPSTGRTTDERIAENARIIVAENIFDTDHSATLVGTHLVSRATSIAFFNDPLRLDRDLLADAAEEAIRALFGQSANVHASAPGDDAEKR